MDQLLLKIATVIVASLIYESNAGRNWNSLASTFGAADSFDWLPRDWAAKLRDPQGHGIANMLRFNDLPITEAEARIAEPRWELLPPGSGDCCGDATAACSRMFRGRRYWTTHQPTSAREGLAPGLAGTFDAALILVFNVRGTLAAVQSSVLKSEFADTTYRPPVDSPLRAEIIGGREYYTMTAYLADPDKICDPMTAQDPATIGNYGLGGDHLHFQNGDSPASVRSVPYYETELQKDREGTPNPTKWMRGQCFPGMGQHYWWRLTERTEGNDFFNFFPLYRPNTEGKGELLGFGFSVNVNMKSSRYEHPDVPKLGKTMRKVPTFFSTDPAYINRISSMHIYFRSDKAAFWANFFGTDQLICIARNTMYKNV